MRGSTLLGPLFGYQSGQSACKWEMSPQKVHRPIQSFMANQLTLLIMMVGQSGTASTFSWHYGWFNGVWAVPVRKGVAPHTICKCIPGFLTSFSFSSWGTSLSLIGYRIFAGHSRDMCPFFLHQPQGPWLRFPRSSFWPGWEVPGICDSSRAPAWQ